MSESGQSRSASAFAGALLALAAAASLAANCQANPTPAQSPGYSGFISADPTAFSIQSVDRFADEQAGTIQSTIVVVAATFTNVDVVPEVIEPDRFVLTDQTTNAAFYGLSGTNINIPSMATTSIEPGKSAEIRVGFRVPLTMTAARLAYHP